MAYIRFKQREEDRFLSGHPWIYRSEVEPPHSSIQDGDVVEFTDHRGKFLGQGYVNTRSQILGRALTTGRETIDDAFFRDRLETAIAFRSRFIRDTDACRLVYSEADRLPGLIVDRYGAYLVVQFLTLGMERRRTTILNILTEMLDPEGVIERSDAPARAHEGLEPKKGVIAGQCPERVLLEERGLRFYADLINGQKTGFFLDQRDNRQMVRRISEGARVFDGFCHTGGFALAAAAGGAVEVTGADLSATAIEMAQQNAVLNGQENRLRFIEGNVFDQLRVYQSEKTTFDVAILDPPAFTRGKSSLPGAMRGYKDINMRAMTLLTPGGYLVTCSCSFHMTDALFRDMLVEAAGDAGRTARIVFSGTQAFDHPVLLAAPETSYLKCLVLQVY